MGKVRGRECGPCVACCITLKIEEPELQKEADVVCHNCTGSGCAIYESRPQACRDWHCLWRRLDSLPEEARPDLTGIVPMFWRNPAPQNPFDRDSIIIRAVNSPHEFDAPLASAVINMFVEEGSLPVYLEHGTRRKLIYPAKAVIDAVMGPPEAVPADLKREVETWRRRLGLD